MFDSHTHTKVSMDCDMPVRDGIKAAREKNLGVVVTDHMDINDYHKNPFVFNPDDFFKNYGPLRNEKFLLGIEMGMRKEATQRNAELISSYDFDFVLVSNHAPHDREDYLEYCSKSLYTGREKESAYNEYFRSMEKGLRATKDFDCLAHIDYIARYSPYSDSGLCYDTHKDAIDEVLKILVEREKALEINGRRLGEKGVLEELFPIYKRFFNLGGKFVTLGSDSHRAIDIGKNLDLGKALAKEIGLSVVHYEKRKPIVEC